MTTPSRPGDEPGPPGQPALPESEPDGAAEPEPASATSVPMTTDEPAGSDRAWQDAPGRPRRRRWLFWPAVVLALGMVAGGGYLAWTAYAEETAPRTVVAQYLAALSSGDAAAALAYGTVPEGSRDLLTDDVLAAQLELAPMGEVEVGAVDVGADTATAAISYELGYPDAVVPVEDVVSLVREGRTWRLEAVVAERTINVTSAADRATLDGETVPDGTYLVFPGALPVGFDTDNLALPDEARVVRLSQESAAEERPVLSPPGRDAIVAAVELALTACLDGTAPTPVLCPLPDDPRAVPGSIRGELSGELADEVLLQLQGNREGRVLISGDISVTGEYQTLDFNNQRVAKTGELTIDLLASCFAVTPETISWRSL